MTEMRDFDRWHASLRNFDWLKEAVSGGMDIDLLIERKGHFMVIEGKPWTGGVRIPWGQHKSLYALSKQPSTRVYIVGEGEDMLHVALVNDAPKPVYVKQGNCAWWPPERFVPTTKEGLAKIVQAWWRAADSGQAAA